MVFFSSTFWKAFYTFKYAPVFELIPDSSHMSPKDAFREGTYKIKLNPLNKFTDADTGVGIGNMDIKFENTVGFKPREVLNNVYETHRIDYDDNKSIEDHYPSYYKLLLWPRTFKLCHGLYCKDLDGNVMLQVQYDKNYSLYANINFDAVPASFFTDHILIEWLHSRGCNAPSNWGRNKILSKVEQGVDMKWMPMKNMCSKNRHHQYVSFETLRGPLEFKKEDLFAKIRSLPEINDDMMAVAFGNKVNTERAYTNVVGGQYDLSTLTTCSTAKFIEGEGVTIFKIVVSPSLKQNPYFVHLVFKKDGTFASEGISRCGCPIGRIICSHMLGLLLIFRLIQQQKEMDLDNFMKKMPPYVRNVNCIVNSSYFFNPHSKKVKIKRKRNQRTNVLEVPADKRGRGRPTNN